MALVGDEGHETAVAPRLPLVEPVEGKACAALRGDPLDGRAAPGRGRRLAALAGETLVEGTVAACIVGDAAGRVQVDGLEGTHEGPAQAEPIGDALVDVLDRGVAVGDEPQRLVEE